MPVATCDDFQSISGASLYISATLPATFNEAGYEALTWTEIGGITSIPPTGGSYGEVSINLVKCGKCVKKGIKTFGSGSIEFAHSLTDTGQIAMKTAYDSYDAVAFKVLYQDGSADYLCGLVMGVPKNNGAADAVQAISAAVTWTTDRVEAAS
jgi:hypothetical protein